MDSAFYALETYNWRVGTVYPSAAYIVEAPGAYWHYDYHTSLQPMRTTLQVSYSAPDYGWKANMLYPTKLTTTTNVQGYGQAPTQGVYTGIPSGCGSSGVHGGNPY